MTNDRFTLTPAQEQGFRGDNAIDPLRYFRGVEKMMIQYFDQFFDNEDIYGVPICVRSMYNDFCQEYKSSIPLTFTFFDFIGFLCKFCNRDESMRKYTPESMKYVIYNPEHLLVRQCDKIHGAFVMRAYTISNVSLCQDIIISHCVFVFYHCLDDAPKDYQEFRAFCDSLMPKNNI